MGRLSRESLINELAQKKLTLIDDSNYNSLTFRAVFPRLFLLVLAIKLFP